MDDSGLMLLHCHDATRREAFERCAAALGMRLLPWSEVDVAGPVSAFLVHVSEALSEAALRGLSSQVAAREGVLFAWVEPSDGTRFERIEALGADGFAYANLDDAEISAHLSSILRCHRARRHRAQQAPLGAQGDRGVAIGIGRTKEFLESLIEATVDAIVAADLTGKIILYNRGAERIYGYRPEEVVGLMNVAQLYPEGVAREVMRRIRAPEHGGVGRLESMHSAAVDKGGRVIPISLSAAMIWEHGVPTATVGIFTDLREKLQAEERLLQAQQKLEVSEKHALLAELAGTAAHELNQPLTSVMGYGELLMRRLEPGTPERNAVQVIMREAERMANLVRKIGKITRYETKSYVGDQRILDLDRASEEPDDFDD